MHVQCTSIEILRLRDTGLSNTVKHVPYTSVEILKLRDTGLSNTV